MIDILRYRELLIEWMNSVNNQTTNRHIEGVSVAVREGHMVRKLRDKRGIWLCSNYPDAQLQHTEDNDSTRSRLLLYVIERVPSGSETDDREIAHYGQLQFLTELLIETILNSPSVCSALTPESPISIEWEFDVFGGWNGLSVSITLRDYDTALH